MFRSMATKAAIYLRISDDQDGEQQSTARQRQDCLAFCERNGWELAQVFEDLDISAFTGKYRPGFEAVLAAAREGTINTMVVWKVDRGFRNLRDFVRFEEACASGGTIIRSVMDGVDTSTPAGQMVATMLVAQARMESENTRTRVKRAMQQAAADGKPHLSGFRPYGYDRTMTTIIPEEAAVIREVVDRALTRESLHAVAVDLNRRGIKTSTGCEWTLRGLRGVITGAHISAQREYEGTLSPGIWPAIVTPAELQRVRAITTARIKRGRPATSPLAGIAKCGLCGAGLAQWTAAKVRRYRCDKQPGSRNCGRIAVAAEPLEKAIADAVLLVMEGAQLPAVEADHSAADVVIAIEEQMAQLAVARFSEASISESEFRAARGALQDRLQQAQRELAKLPVSTPRRRVTAEQWAALSADDRRTETAALLECVRVGPAPQRGRVPFDLSRLEFVWRL
jgi:site-specific DNA recombinase